MKNLFKHITIAGLTSAMLMFSACRDVKSYISGNLVSLPDGKVCLYGYDGTLTAMDSTTSHNGRFTLTQPQALPDLAFVGFESLPDLLVPVLLDGSRVYISGNLNYKDDITVSGTKANDELREYTLSIRNTDIMARAIEIELDTMDPTEDSVRYAQMKAKRDSLRNSIARSRSEFVRRNPSSLVSAMFLDMSFNDSMTRQQVDSLINCLDSTTVDNAFLQRLRFRLEHVEN